MATMAGAQKDVRSMLKELIELDFDAIDAYRAAIERLEDSQTKSKLSEFMGDHQRHTRDLSNFMREMGGTPPSEGDVKSVLTAGKVKLADLAGDKAILKAMKTNEDDTNKAYERAVKNEGLTADLAATLQGNLEDERRHRAWIEQRLDAM